MEKEIILILLTILVTIFALWTSFYCHKVKNRNKIIENLKEYEQKERKNKYKVSSSK